jgi:hypothetical protein
MVGLRVLDLGLLAAWLVWFFRMRDDDSDDEGPGGGGPGPEPSDDSGPRGPGVRLPQSGRRARDHAARPAWRPSRRPARRIPGPLPARVRRPRAPVPAHRP